MADREVAPIWTFPTDPARFGDDERISFSRLDRKYIAVQDDGTEFEFDQSLKRWIPLADEDADLGADADRGYQQQPAASRKRRHDDAPDHAYYHREPQDQRDPHRHGGSSNSNSNSNSSSSNNNNNTSTSTSNKRVKAAAPAARQPKQNTAVYVTGLPADATVDEVAELFSRKCGVIAEEIDSGRPRIKMYTGSDGRFKGDALVVFFKPQSVDMAIMLLDDTEFRFASAPGPRMRVQAADASYKKTSYQSESAPAPAPAADGGGSSSSSSSSAQAAQGGPRTTRTTRTTRDPRDQASSSAGPAGPGRGGGASQDKQKIIKKTQKLDAKLADWSSDEDERFAGLTRGGGRGGGGRSAKWDKVVVLRHMFTLAELDEDPAALLDIKEDIREECSKLGDVTNVVLFDQEPAGIVSVKFRTAEAAAACVRLMGGRAFDGRIVEASLATGREKYKKSKKGDDDGDKSSSEEGD